jgi:general secretion pathway protein J
LVVAAILGIIMVTVYGVLSKAISAKNHSEEVADLNASGREAVLKIADELEGALPPTAGRGVGFIGVAGKDRVPTDAVQFAIVIRRTFGVNQHRGGRALVSYSLDPMKDAPNLFALRRQEELLVETPPVDDNADAPDATPGQEEQTTIAGYLIDQVAALRLRYLDPNSGEFVDAWDTTVDQPPGQPPISLPGAVEVTLFLADNNGGVHDFGTIVDLPLANLFPTPGPQ